MLMVDQGETFSNSEKNRRLVGKLIYLNIISLIFLMLCWLVNSRKILISIIRMLKAPRQELLYEDKVNAQIIGYFGVD